MRRSPQLLQKKLLLLSAVICCLMLVHFVQVQFQEDYPTPPELTERIVLEHQLIISTEDESVKRWLELRKNISHGLSKLGRILFLSEEPPDVTGSTKRYKILIWKYGSTLENRHIKNYSGKRTDPFEHCSVSNCDITYSEKQLHTADLVLFHLHRMKGTKDLPTVKHRPSGQIWAFLTDESPHHTFLTPKVKLKDFNGVFNWSVSYRKDADIPVPYGRTVLRKYPSQDDVILNKKRDVLIAILGSNCGGRNNRWKYVRELQKYIEVDIYGNCGNKSDKSCPGHFQSDCSAIDRYLFYLSFENSNCDDYITEKLWWNAYHKNSIPIVMGANIMNYKMLLPPDSYINVDEFASPAVLAQFIYRLNETDEFKKYYQWHRYFEVLNEHGYFKSRSVHYCRICEALHYNDKSEKVYSNLENFWSVKRDCYPAWDELKWT